MPHGGASPAQSVHWTDNGSFMNESRRSRSPGCTRASSRRSARLRAAQTYRRQNAITPVVALQQLVPGPPHSTAWNPQVLRSCLCAPSRRGTAGASAPEWATRLGLQHLVERKKKRTLAYPIPSVGAIYSPDVFVFRSSCCTGWVGDRWLSAGVHGFVLSSSVWAGMHG